MYMCVYYHESIANEVNHFLYKFESLRNVLLIKCFKLKFFLKKWAIPGLFYCIFVFSVQLTVNKCSI